MRQNKRKTILIAGIETIRHKNLNQFRVMDGCGYDYLVITTDQGKESESLVGEMDNVELVVTKHGFKGAKSLWTFFNVLLRSKLHAAEIYPYSHVVLIMAMLLRLFKIPIIAISRGEEQYYLNNTMSFFRAKAFKWTFQLANHVIYKEPYMEKFLDIAGCRSRFFLSNSVAVPRETRVQAVEGCTLLFLNSIKGFRNPTKPLKAFLNLCRKHGLTKDSPYRLQIVGFQGAGVSAEVDQNEAEVRGVMHGVADVPVELLPWTKESATYIHNADVFLLPTTIVFLNFALLEAMAYGLPPLVSDTPDSTRVIDANGEGLIVEDDVAAWEEAIETVMFDASLRSTMGAAAKRKIKTAFSLSKYKEQYALIYDQVIK